MSITSTVPFTGTKEQEEKLMAIIEESKNDKSLLMPVLQKAQAIYGYLPLEVQKLIAEGMDIPLSEIYGVVTFYTQFSLFPKGKYQVSVCLGTACYVRGSGQILDELKRQLGIDVGQCSADMKYSLDATRCVGACGLAPVMIINEDVYGKMTTDDVEGILKKYQ
jgi:NADP-reducing hydrogenase subunit HndA